MWHQIIFFFYSRHLCLFIVIFIILFLSEYVWFTYFVVQVKLDVLHYNSLPFLKNIYIIHHDIWHYYNSVLRILFVTSFTVPRLQNASRQHFIYAIFCLSLMMNILFSIRYVTCRKKVYHYFLKILPYNSISVCRSFE